MLAKLSRRAVASFLVGLVAASLADASSAQADPLRHITFSYSVNHFVSTEVRSSGIGTASSGVSTQSASGQDRGTIVVDVIAATQDGGLVVDVSQQQVEPVRQLPVVRIAVLGNGDLTFDPEKQISNEEIVVARYLARGFVPAGELTVGTGWKQSQHGANMSRDLAYRVTALPSSEVLQFTVDGEEKVTGAGAYTQTLHGTGSYNVKRLVPEDLVVKSYLRVDRASATTADSQVHITLVSDSMKPK